MATHKKFQPITLEDEWFRGTKAIFRFTVYDENDAIDDPALWALSWILRKNKSSADYELNLVKPTDITVVSEQVLVAVTATMTDDFEVGTYYHQLWRTDTGLESVLAFGPAELQR